MQDLCHPPYCSFLEPSNELTPWPKAEADEGADLYKVAPGTSLYTEQGSVVSLLGALAQLKAMISLLHCGAFSHNKVMH